MPPIRGRSARNYDHIPNSHRPQPGVKKRAYVFTCNNYDTHPDRREALEAKLRGNEVSWAIFAPEVGERTGTPHLQGYVYFKNQVSWCGLCDACPGTWFKPANGNHQSQWDYITKQCGEDLEELCEFGRRPNFDTPSKQGGDATREMWERTLQWAKDGEWDKIPANIYIQHRRTLLDIHKEQKNKVVPMEGVELRLWQRKLVRIIEGPVDSRKIYWFWEDVGNVGKSFMATYLLRNHQATVLSTGKTADIAYLLDAPKIVVFDISRALGLEHINFGVMEDIKNGRIFSPKYESIIKSFDVPHIIVFANEPCPYGKFSADRLEEIKLVGDYMTEPIPEEIGSNFANGDNSGIDGTRADSPIIIEDDPVPPPVLRRQPSESRTGAPGFVFPTGPLRDIDIDASIDLSFLVEQDVIDWNNINWG